LVDSNFTALGVVAVTDAVRTALGVVAVTDAVRTALDVVAVTDAVFTGLAAPGLADLVRGLDVAGSGCNDLSNAGFGLALADPAFAGLDSTGFGFVDFAETAR
jgi:hypothetical protein